MEFLIIVAILVVWFFYREAVVKKGIQRITTNQLKPPMGNTDKQFIDVRTPGEFEKTHITGFKNIPLYEFSQRLNELDKDEEVFVMSGGDMRSSKACQQLKKNGFKHITQVRGGIGSLPGKS